MLKIWKFFFRLYKINAISFPRILLFIYLAIYLNMKYPKTIFYLISVLTLFCNLAKAQVSFSHAIGMSMFFSTKTITGGYGINYSPRINFLEMNEMTLSAGTHLSLGYNKNFSSSNTGNNHMFCLDIPLMLELNFGQARNPYENVEFGGFFGIGYGYNNLVDNEYGISNSDHLVSMGTVLNAGLRFFVYEQAVGFRTSYMLNNKTNGENILGFSVFYTFIYN